MCPVIQKTTSFFFNVKRTLQMLRPFFLMTTEIVGLLVDDHFSSKKIASQCFHLGEKIDGNC